MRKLRPKISKFVKKHKKIQPNEKNHYYNLIKDSSNHCQIDIYIYHFYSSLRYRYSFVIPYCAVIPLEGTRVLGIPSIIQGKLN